MLSTLRQTLTAVVACCTRPDLQVKASQALVIPAGWFYASATPVDSLAVGCFFWHPFALGDVARAQHEKDFEKHERMLATLAALKKKGCGGWVK